MSSPTFYFEGVDPAPAQGARSDDGAIVVLRARPKFTWTEEEYDRVHLPTDFELAYVHARKCRNLSGREWSGLIHRDNDRFQLAKICMDPGGAGLIIRREMAERAQLIHGMEVDRLPITTPDDTRVVTGLPKLVLFKRGDPGMDVLFPSLPGDDVLLSHAHLEFKQIIDTAGVMFPPAEFTRDQMAGWPEEQMWASKNLKEVVDQLAGVTALTNDEGIYLLTARNAHRFGSRGKKDLAYAAMYAYMAFLVWLKSGELADSEGNEGAEMFDGF